MKDVTLALQGFASCLHFSGRRSIFLIRINGHLVQCRPLEHSLEAQYHSHARLKPFIFLVSYLSAGSLLTRMISRVGLTSATSPQTVRNATICLH